MSRAKSVFVAFCLVGLIGTAWAAQRSKAPADALAPANDHVAQLERRVAELEAQIDKLERLLPSPSAVPANWTVSPPMLALPPAPLPDPEEHEANGVKFRFYLLGSEAGAPTRR